MNAVDLLYAEIREGFRRKEVTGKCSLDIAKAFDSVYSDGLVYKVDKVIGDRTIVKMTDKSKWKATHPINSGKREGFRRAPN